MQYHRTTESDDCLRTALACVLDRPPHTIPNFASDEYDKSNDVGPPHKDYEQYNANLARNVGADPQRIARLDRFHNSYAKWLADEGYGLLRMPWAGTVSNFLQYMAAAAPDVYWILGARTGYWTEGRRPFLVEADGHAFVMRGGKVVHDPAHKPGALIQFAAGCFGLFILHGATAATANAAEGGRHD